MSSVFESEKAAARLHERLKSACRPELQILCILRFFDTCFGSDPKGCEPYLREFVPVLTQAAEKTDSQEFLSEETASLRRLISLADSKADAADARDLEILKGLAVQQEDGFAQMQAVEAEDTDSVCVHCLFVEHNPDLGLPPRGRLLLLRVKATPISVKAENDDIVVRNPVDEPDDRFLSQARDSVLAARKYLQKRFGLPPGKRYRLDFIFDSHCVRFTGDSLGVAFAVGVVAAIADAEVFRSSLSIPAEAAFSGALSPEGTTVAVDAEALKLKIHRAFHSNLRYLVIPRQHVTMAWEYLSELEKDYPGRKLEPVGAETLEAIADDPRLIRPEKFSIPAYIGHKIRQARRSNMVEIPALLVLAAILFILVAPGRWMPWFEDNPASTRINHIDNSLEVINKDGEIVWADTIQWPMKTGPGAEKSSLCINDLDGDGHNEVLFMPPFKDICEDRCRFFCYSSEGDLLFKRNGVILGKYPGDSDTAMLNPLGVSVYQGDNEKVIVSLIDAEYPSHCQIRAWDALGNDLGWYINSGQGGVGTICDIDGDGKAEVFFGGINNRLGCAVLAVIELDFLSGVSPPYTDDDWDLTRVKPAVHKAYILFPPSEVCVAASNSKYNMGSGSAMTIQNDGTLRFRVSEVFTSSVHAFLDYYLDKDFRVYNVRFSDTYRTLRERLVKEHRLKDKPPMEEKTSLVNAVAYWTGSEFVSEAERRTTESGQ